MTDTTTTTTNHITDPIAVLLAADLSPVNRATALAALLVRRPTAYANHRRAAPYRLTETTPEARTKALVGGSLRGIQAEVRKAIARATARVEGPTESDVLVARERAIRAWDTSTPKTRQHSYRNEVVTVPWTVRQTTHPYYQHLLTLRDKARHQRAQQHAQACIEAGILVAAETCLRQAADRWVDRAGTSYTVTLGAAGASSESNKVWHSKYGKRHYPGTSVTYRLTVPADWPQAVGAVPGLAAAGGLLTLAATLLEGCAEEESDADAVWSATWVVLGRGFAVSTARGYIKYRRSSAQWLHGLSLESLRRQEASLDLAERMRRNAQRVATMTLDDIAAEYGDRRIKLPQEGRTTPAGNCSAGCRAWAARNLDGAVEVTVAALVAWLQAGGRDQRSLVEREVRTAAVLAATRR